MVCYVLQGRAVFIDFLSSILPRVRAGQESDGLYSCVLQVRSQYSDQAGRPRVHIAQTPLFGFINAWAFQVTTLG